MENKVKLKLEYYKDKNVGDCFIIKENDTQVALAIFKSLDSQKVYNNYNIQYSKNINNIDDDLMCIELIKVTPIYQLKGLGTHLVNKIIQKANEAKCKGVFVRAEPFEDSALNFEELIKFYKKFGFIEVKRISKNECLMLLAIN